MVGNTITAGSLEYDNYMNILREDKGDGGYGEVVRIGLDWQPLVAVLLDYKSELERTKEDVVKLSVREFRGRLFNGAYVDRDTMQQQMFEPLERLSRVLDCLQLDRHWPETFIEDIFIRR